VTFVSARSHSYGENVQTLLDSALAGRRRREVEAWVPDGGVAVDLGCGHGGDLLVRLAPRLREGVGLDLSVQDEPPAPNIRLLRARVDRALPLADASADLITCLAVLEHVERPDVLLREAHRVLRPGGVLLVTTPAREAKPILELLTFRLRLIDAVEILDHKRYYSPAMLRAAIVSAGFRAERVRIRRFELGLNLAAVARADVSLATAPAPAPAGP